MKQFLTALFSALILLFSCSLSTDAASGQRTLTLPAGGFYPLNLPLLEQQLGVFQSLTVTLLPDSTRAVLFFHGKPLAANQILTRRQTEELFAFVRIGPPVTLGVLPFPETSPLQPIKIRCINPFFSGNPTESGSPTFKEAVFFD